MKLHSILATVGVIIALLHTAVLACAPQPPLKAVSDGTVSGNVGETLTFSGLNKFYCPDGGQIVDFRWVLPPQAYHAEGDNTSELKCKFSPSGTYEVELQVKCSHGIWNTEHLNYPNSNRYVYVVTVSPVSGPWYVKPDGSDADSGRSWETAFRTIQTAINSAVSGQEIIVESGSSENPVIYYEQLDLKGKSLTIRSDDPDNWEAVENTIIDAGQCGTTVLYRGTEAGELKGFTITGGTPMGDGLALHFSNADPANAGVDLSGKGRHGTVHGPAWVPDGYNGGALSFDGIDDYIEIPGYPGVVGKGSRTCMAWVKTSGTTTSPYAVMSWGKDCASDSKFVFALHPSGRVCVYTCFSGIVGTTYVNDGNWHHIAAVLDSDGSPTLGEVKLYVDGILQAVTFSGGSGASLAPVNTEVGDFLVGAYDYEDIGSTGLGAWYQGQMAGLRLYSRALSESEIRQQIWGSPVAHWKLDEESGSQADDSSGKDLHGTLINFSASPWTSGHIGGGLEFDGSSYITTSWPGITGGASRLCSAWVKTTATSGSHIVMAWGTQSLDNQARYWQFGLGNGKIAVGDTNSHIYGTTMIADGQWHHIAAVLDSLASPITSNIKLYVDGVQETISYSFQAGRTINTGGDNLILGARFANGNYAYYQGSLDDVRIYDRALGAFEIQELAERRNLVARWTFDGNALDSSGYGHDGDLENDPLFTSGIAGQSLTFNGTDQYVSVPHHPRLKPQFPLTLSAWINPASSVANGVIIKIDSSNNPNNYYSGVSLRAMSDTVVIGYGDGTAAAPSGRGTKVGTTVLQPHRWYHVVGIIRGPQDMSIYINGQDDGGDYTGTSTQPIYYEGNEVLIGNSIEQDQAFNGNIDDVRIYNFGLSRTEVLSLYQTRFADGGGIRGHGATSTIEKCIFIENCSRANGGGIYRLNGTVRNCLFIRNASDGFGGAIAESSARIENCTFVNNSAVSGGALHTCIGNVMNNILWGNTPNQLVDSLWLSYNCIQNWTQGGTGIISENPHFQNPAEDNYRLLLSSPCIDAGNPASDYSHEPDPNGLRINLGAYGNTADAAKSYEGYGNWDTSGDGIPDWWAIMYGFDPHAYIADQWSPGSDGKLTNMEEYQYGTNPLLYDTSGDGIPDWWAIGHGLNPLDPTLATQTSANSQGMLTNQEEYWAGTNPNLLSTIDDDLPDWWKIRYGLDPLCSDVANPQSDYDDDGVSNFDEYLNGTHPLHHNTESMIVEYEYDEYGRLKYQTVRDGQENPEAYSVTEYDYDELGRQRRQRNYHTLGIDNDIQEDRITLTVYDVQGQVTMTVRKAGTSVDPEVVENGDLVVLNKYYGTGVLWKTIQGTYNQSADDHVADPKVTEYIYQNEQLYQVKAPRHGTTELDRAVTTYHYDAAGRTWKVVEATGHYREMTYDSLGQVIKETAFKSDDTPRMQIRYEFDKLGRLLREAVMALAAAPDTQAVQTDTDKVTDYYYDTDGVNRYYPGQLVAKTIYYTANGTPATRYFDYDELEREIIVKDPDDNYKSVAYDGMNRIKHIVEFFDNPVAGQSNLILSTRYKYDSSGRLRKLIQEPDPLDESTWRSTVYHYDAADRKRKEVKPNGVETTFDYNGWGNVVKNVADAAAGGRQQTTEYTYDRLGRQITITGYTGVGTTGTKQTTTYAYTDLDKVAQIEYPDEETIEYTYYDNGMVKTRTDQRGLVTTYAYDAAGTRLLTKTVTQSGIATVESFTYDALGRMDTAEKMQGPNPVSYSDFAYYDSGLLQSEQQTLFGGTPRTVSYAYDPAGHRTSIVYPDGTTEITRTTTWDGRIDRLSRNATTLVEYEYVGPYVARRAYRGLNGPDVQADYLYDALGRLTAIEVGALAGFVYGYVPAEDNIETMTFTHRANDPANSFGYDTLDRLTDVEYLSDNQDVEDFSAMDNLGNRTGTITQRDGVRDYTTDSLTNRYTAIAGNPLAYDDAGNLTQDKDGYQFTYDYENRITRIFKLDGQTEIDVAGYAYDALGRRICKTSYDSVPSVAKLYYYSDNWQVLAEYNGSGVQQAYYIFGNYIDEVLVLHRNTADHYYLHDHLYSPVALLDDDGDVLERYEYDAYGKVTLWNAAFTTTYMTSQYGNPYAFTGRELDILDGGNLHHIHYRHRDYHPEIGRFMQRDTLDYIDGMNAYQYTGSNPINSVDPMGLKFSYAASEFWYKQVEQIITPSWPAMARLISDGRGNWSLGSYSGQIGLVNNEALMCLFWLESKFNSKADAGFGRGMGYGIGQMTTQGAQEVNRYNKFGPDYPNDKHNEIYKSIGELANGFRDIDWRDRIKGDVHEQISLTIAYLLTLARRDNTNSMREILKKYGPGDAPYSEYADVILDCEKCVRNSQKQDMWGVPLPANSSEKDCKNCLELADEQRAEARANNPNR